MRIKLGELLELALTFVARVDRAHDPDRAQRLAVRTGEPAASILQPESLCRVAALERVLHLIGNAVAGIMLTGLLERIYPALAAFVIDMLGVGLAARDLSRIGQAEDRCGIAAPGQGVAVEAPFIGDIADRAENLRGVRDTSRLIKTGHARPFLERLAAPGVTSPVGCSAETTANP